MRKRLLSLLLFVLVGLSAVQAAYDFSVVVPSGQTLYFDITSNSNPYKVCVTYPGSSYSNPYYGYTEPIGNLVVPNTITYQGTTYSVTSIGEGAFEFCSGLTSVTIPNSVTSIGYYAFRNCSGLTSVTIPNSVTSIGSSAFRGCSGLTSVTIPNSVTSIGYNAFYYCSGLTTLNFNAINCGDFNSGSSHPFYNCPITTINIGDSVQRIPAYFADNLESLTSVTIPNSVTSIGEYAFRDCSGLTSVTIPNSVTSIGEYAFRDCSGLTSVTIPNSVTSIGYNAFSGCSGLTTLNFNAINCSDFTYNPYTSDHQYPPFYNCPITTINIGDSVQRIPACFAYNLDSLNSITIPNSVTSIGYNAFYYCSGLTTLNFNAINCGDFNSGSSHPFYNCPITTINIGDSVQRIPAYFADNLESLTSVTIPNSVTSIGYYAFRNCNGLTSVTIPNSVTSIGRYAFAYCSGLTSVTIPNTIDTIRNYTFYNCSGLTSVIIPNSVTSIGECAFDGCSGLTSVTIPNSVTSIGNSAFSGCSGLTTLNFNAINCGDFSSSYHPFYNCPIATINIGDSVQWIPAYFAYNLDSLTTVTIGKSVTSIASSAFRYCNGLTTLNFNAINCSDFTYNTSSYNSQYPPFYNCPISTINIGDSVQRIPAYFAYNLDSLNSITIPNSIISIGNSAFRSCNSLTTLNFNAINCSNFTYNTSSSYNSQYPPFYNCPISTINIGDSVQRIPNYFAYNLHSLTSVTIPNSVTSIGNSAFYGCSGLTSVTIPNNVDTIRNYTFYGCTGLTSITIPNSVTSIGNYAFSDCNSLTTLNFNAINCGNFSSSYHPFYNCPIATINIGDSVQRIPNYFAYNLHSLTSVTIPNSVTSIGYSAFYNCSGLTSVTIPNSVTSIGNYAFYYCDDLTTLNFNAINCGDFSSSYHPFYNCPIATINIGDSVQQIPASFADGLVSLTSVTIPNSVTSIGDGAFYYCSGLTSVTIPNSVTSIGYSAFYNCSGLTSVTIPNNVDTIRNYTFYGCTGLTSITISDSVTYIGYSAFSDCNSLDSVDIPNSVTSIGGSAFNGCSSLVSVDIPNSVTTIGGSAFSGCSNLVSVSVSNNIDTIRNSTFENCSSLSSITIPNNVRYIGEKAFYRNSNLRILNFNAINCDDFTNDSYHQFYECPISVIVIGDSVMRIPAYFNYSLDSLSSLTIGHNITSLNSTMIDNCTNLRTLNFNAINCNDLSLESYPFYNAPIATINIGDSVQRIPAHFAYDIDSLTSITIPDSVTYIGNAAFNGCNSLTSATIGSSVASIGDSAFSYCTSLDSIVIPNSVTLIGNYAFDSCSSLVSASIDSSVVTIGNSAFKDCSSLSSIIVPNSVTSIGNSAFKNCSNLFLAIISNNIEAIEDYTFYNCSSLGSITLNNSITSIGDSTFYNCSSLDTIIIPNSVTTIGKSAFGNCANLAFATISSGINRIEESTFENCNSLATITIPNSVANIADKAFNGCYNLREVVSLAVLPPALGANIFSGTAILKVPCGSLDYYTSASAGWSQYFVGIEEMCSNIVITVTSSNESMGTVSGGGEYEFGTEVTITATPNQGYRFVSWNDGNTDNPRTITVTEDATYIASFEESVGIESRDMLSELTFYPNPTSGIITFNRNDIMKVEVLDAMGRMVAVYENTYTIDISKLAKGYYAMRITTPEGVAVRKVVRK